MALAYPKTENLYVRDMENKTFKLVEGVYKLPQFGQIKEWLVTEKIDGTNIRVTLEKCRHEIAHPELGSDVCSRAQDKCDDDRPNCLHCSEWSVRIDGRSDNAQIPSNLLNLLNETFTLEAMKKVWIEGGEYEFTLFGEGYGEGIQKGGWYRKGVNFRLFDVLIGGHSWLSWDNVCDVANKLSIKTAPSLGFLTEHDIFSLVRGGLNSIVAWDEKGEEHLAEGVVARTDPYLYDASGHPFKFKLKGHDIERGG